MAEVWQAHDRHLGRPAAIKFLAPQLSDDPEFLVRFFAEAQAVARISLGLQQTLSLGNIEARRDWGFAGDYVEAMYLMLQQDEGDDFVIATGETHSISDLLDAAFSVVGISDWSGLVGLDPRYARPAEVDVLIGDSSKANSVLGWKPKVSFLELVEMMVQHDIERQRSAA